MNMKRRSALKAIAAFLTTGFMPGCGRSIQAPLESPEGVRVLVDGNAFVPTPHVPFEYNVRAIGMFLDYDELAMREYYMRGRA